MATLMSSTLWRRMTTPKKRRDEDVDEIDNDEEANHEQQNEAENQVEDDEEGKHLVGYAHYLHVFAKEFGWFCCYLDEPFRFSEKKAVPGAVNKSNEAVDDPEPPNPPKFFPNGRKNPQWKRGKDKWKKWYERERKRKEKLEQQANEEELQSTNLFFRIPKLLYKKSCGVKCKDPKPKWNSLTWSALFVITVGLYLGVSLGIVYRWVFSAGNGSLALFAGVDEESGCTAPITGGGECSEGVATSGQTGGTISAAADAATTPTEKEVVFASEKLPQLPWAKKKPQLPEEEAAAAVAEKVRTSTSRKGANTKGEEAVDRTEDARKILRNKNTSSLTTGKTEEPQGATGSRFAADRQKTTHTSTDAEQSSSRSPVVEEHNEAAKVKGKEKKRVYKIRPGRDYTDRSVPRRAVTDALRAFVDQGGVESVRRLHQAKILREKNDDTSAPGPRLDPASPPSEAPSPTAGAVFSPAPTSIAEGDPASSDSGIPLTTSRGRVGDNDSRPRKFESAPTAQPLEHDNEHHARLYANYDHLP
ncbi:unnamed protein product [Amoebophrya sp. A120]|nr:unnamed protein product [Amoebophrya sp. A120]|eukprot:GSA120T00024309001.1